MARNVSIVRGGKTVRSIRRNWAIMAAVAAGSLLASGLAQADVYWTGTGTSWNSATSWNTNVDGVSGTSQIPGAADLAIFSATTVTTDQATTLDAPFSILGLVLNNTGYAVSITDPTNGLTLGTSGITVNAGAGAVTVAAPITLGVAQAWTNNGAGLMTISGNITSGANLLTIAGSGNTSISGVVGIDAAGGGLTMNGTGTLTLAALNTYTGATSITSGTVNVTGSLGNTAIGVSGGKLSLQSVGAVSQNTLTVSGAGNLVETVDNAISGTTALNVTGGTATLTNLNNFTGATQVNGGVLTVSNAGALASSALTLTSGKLQLRADSNTAFATASTVVAGTVTVDVNQLATGTGNTLSLGAVNIGANQLNVTGGNADVLGLGAVTLTGSAVINPTTASVAIASVTGTNNLTLQGSATANSVGAITTNTGTVTFSGGTWSVTGTNTYSGNTSISAGQVDVTGTFGNTAIGVSGGTLSLQATGAVSQNTVTLTGTGQLNQTVANALSGSTALTVNGVGATAALSQSNNYTGLTTLAAGAANFVSGGLGTGTITFTGGTLQYASGNTQDVSLRILNSTGAISVDTGTNNVTFGGALSNTDTGGLTKLGLGTLTLANANNYTGNTSITVGEVDVTGAFGNTAIGLSGGTLSLQAVGAVNKNTLTVSGTGSLLETVANAIGGTAALTVSGSTVTLTQPNNYSGTTTLSGGTLNVNNNSAISTSTLTITSGTLDSTTSGITLSNNPMNWNGSFAFAGTNDLNLGTGAVTVNGGNTYTMTTAGKTLTVGGTVNNNGNLITIAGAGNIAFNGVVSGGGGLTMSGTGTVTLSAANTLTGNTTISSGTVLLNNANALQQSNVTVSVNNGLTFGPAIGTFNIGGLGGANNISMLDTGSSAVTLVVDGASSNPSTTYSGILSGAAGSLVKAGTGTLTLGGISNYTGATIVRAGTVTFNTTTAALTGTTGITVGGGATFQDGSTTNTNNNTLLTGRLPSAANLTLGGIVAPTPSNGQGGVFTIEGAGTGTVNQTLGTLTINAGASLINSQNPNGATITFAGGAGGYVRNTGGALFVNLNGGTAVTPKFTAAPTGASVVGGVLVGAFIKTAADGNTLSLLAANTGNFGAPATVTTWGAGNNTLITGNLTVTTGALTTNSLGLGGADTVTIPTGSTAVISSGNIYLAGGGANARSITGGFLTSGNGQDLITANTVGAGGTAPAFTIASVITDNGATSIGLTIDVMNAGSAPVTLSAANTFTGPTTINYVAGGGNPPSQEAALLTNSLALQFSTVQSNINNGIQFSGISAATIGGLTGSTNLALANAAAGAVNLSIGNGNGVTGSTTTYAGVLSGIGGITKIGSGTLTLTGANLYTGSTTINAGMLVLGSTTAIGPAANASVAFGASSTGTLTLNGNSITITGLSTSSPVGTPVVQNANGSSVANVTLTANIAANNTFAGVLQNGSGGGTLALTKGGAANLTLAGVNTYTGATAVNAGQLTLADGSALANTAITVSNAGSTFAATPLTGHTITASGSLSLGASTVFSMAGDSNTGTMSVGGALSINANTFKFDLGSASGVAAADQLVATGAASTTGSGTISITGFGTPSSVTGTYPLITANGSGLLGAAFSLASSSVIINNIPYGLGLTNSGTVESLVVTAAPQWIGTVGGSWGDNTKWSGSIPGSAAGDIAQFGITSASAQPVTMDGNRKLGSLFFNNPNATPGAYTIDGVTGGPYTLTFDNGASAPILSNTAGSNTINAAIALNGTPTITVGTGLSLTLGQPVSNGTNGAQGLTLNAGTGTLILSGANNYTGATSVSTGTISVTGSLGNTAVGISGTGVLALGATSAVSQNTITLTGTGSLTESAANAISGTAALTVSGGTATLSQNNNYTGATLVNGGTLNVNGTLGNTVVSVSSGTLALGFAQAISHNTITVSGTGNLTESVANSISGTAALTVSGGTALLSQANNYSGNTSVSGGVLTASATGAFGTSTISLSSGTLNLNAAQLISAGTFTITGGTLAEGTPNAISNSAALTVTAGTATLSQANNYTGNTLVNGGTLTASATGAFGTGVVSISSGTLNLNAAQLITTGTLNVSGGAVTENTANAISGTTALNITAGTVTLSVANNFSGTTSLAGGTLVLNAAGAMGTSVMTITSGTLNATAATTLTTTNAMNFNGNFAFTGGANLNLGTGVVTLNATPTITVNGNTLTIGGNVTGVGFGITKAGANTLTLAGANNYTGNTSVTAGTLIVTGSLGNTAVGVSAGTLALNAAQAIKQNTLTVNGGTVTENTANAISGTTALTMSSGTVTLSVANNYSGATSYSGGALNLNIAGAISASALTVTAGSLTPGTANDLSGTASLIVSGGTVTMAQNQNYSGGTTLNSGTLAINTSTTALGTGALTIAGGTITTTGDTINVNENWNANFIFNTTTGLSTATSAGTSAITLGASVTVNLPGTGLLTVPSNIGDGANTFSLATTGVGSILLSGNNTFKGGVNVGGTTTLDINSATALGTGTLTIGAGTTIDSTVAGVTETNNNLQTWNGNFTFKGTQSLNLGTGVVTLGATPVITVTANTLTVGGNITGTGNGITKAGAGTLVLAGASNYTGATTVNLGTLSVTGTLGNTAVGVPSGILSLDGVGAINQNAVTVSGTGSLTQSVANAISGSASLNVNGAGGKAALSQGNNYTGGTQIGTGGTVTITNGVGTSATGSGLVSVTGTLVGNGYINSASTVTVTGGGALAPHLTAGTTGTMNITASSGVTLADLSNLNFNFGAPGTNDILNVTGNVALGGQTNLNITGLTGMATGNYVFMNVTGTIDQSIGFIQPVGGPGYFSYNVVGPADFGGVANEMILQVTAKPPVTWTGAAGTGGSGTWDLLSSNWSTSPYVDQIPVVFDDSGINTNITVSGTLNPAIVTFNNSLAHPYSIGGGSLAGSGFLIKNGTGKVTLTGSNNYTGGSTINNGTIAINSDTALGAISGGLTINAGTLEITTAFASTRNIILGDPAAAISVDAAVNYTQSGILSGPGALNASGLGTITLSAANNYGGGTTLAGGTMVLAGSSVGAPLAVTSGPIGTGAFTGFGTLQADDNATGDRTIANAININGTTTFAASGLTNKRALILTGAASISGSPSITFSDNQSTAGTSFQGLTTLNSSATFNGAGKASFTGGFSVPASATLTYNTTGTQTISGSLGSANPGQTLTINGTGNVNYGALSNGAPNAVALSIAGSGTHSFTVAGTYSGGTTIGGTATVTTTAPGAFGSGPIVMTGAGPKLQFVANGSVQAAGFTGKAFDTTATGYTQYHDGTTPTIAGDTLTLNSGAAGVFDNNAAWYNSKVTHNGFTAAFTYQITASDANAGAAFVFENESTATVGATVPSNPGLGGIRADGDGYLANGAETNGTPISSSAAFGWTAGANNAAGPNDVFAGVNSATTGGFVAIGTGGTTTGGGINFANGDPVRITVTGTGSSAVLNYTMTDLTNPARTASGFVTLSGTLDAVTGASTSWIGFTAGDQPGNIQNISNFQYITGFAGVFAVPNALTVSADSTVDVSYAGGTASMASLSIGANNLTVTNLAGGGATLTVGPTTLSGNPTFTPVGFTGQTTTLSLGAINDGGTARTITIAGGTGAGTGAVTLGSAATSMVDGTIVNITGGTLNSNNATALGSFAAVNVASGATFSLGASQTINTLSDLGGPVVNGASVLLNGNTLTVGTTDNLSSTFSGVLGNGSPAGGGLAKAGTGKLTLAGNSTYTGGTAIQAGKIVLGANNALPVATTLTSGLGGTNGTLDLAGFNQQIGGLAVGAGANAAAQTITSSSGTPTLTYVGASTTYGGILSGSLALALNTGSVTLTGVSNTYSGGTTVVTGTTLTLANASGSATGTGSVTLNGGTLASAAAGGSMSGTVIAGSAAHIITPAGTGTIGTMGVGALTLSGNSTLNFDVNGASSDSLAITNALSISSGTPTINLTLTNLTGFDSFTLATFASTPVTLGNVITNSTFNVTGTPILGYTLVLEATDLKLQAPPHLTWNGTINNGITGDWNTSTANWVAGTYAQYDVVSFDDNATGVRNVNLTSDLVTAPPTVVVVNNDVSHTGNAALNYTFSGNGTGFITGATSLLKQGFGTLTISNTGNNYTGGTFIQNGTIALGVNNALPTAGKVTIGNTGTSGRLDLAGFNQTVAGLATAGTASAQIITNSSGIASTLTFAGGSSTFGGSIQDDGQMLLSVTSGTLSLTGTNNYTGATTVSGGTLSLDATNAITASPVTITGTGVLAESVPNALSGTASLNINGPTVTVSQTNSYSGGTNIQLGTLKVGVLNALPTAGTVTIGSTGNIGTLDLNGFNQTIGGLATAGTASSQIITNSSAVNNATLNFAGGSSTYAGNINNGASKTTALQVSSGTLTLTSAGNFSGGTTLSGGVLNINADTVLGNGPLAFAGGTLQAGASTVTIGATRVVSIGAAATGVIDTAGNNLLVGGITGATSTGLTKINGGTLTLTSPSTYAGATLVSGGILKLGATSGGAAPSAPAILSTAVVNVSATSVVGNPATVSSVANLGTGGGTFSNTGGGITGTSTAPGYSATAIGGHPAFVFTGNTAPGTSLGSVNAYTNTGNAVSIFFVENQPTGTKTGYPGELSFTNSSAAANDWNTPGNMAVEDDANGVNIRAVTGANVIGAESTKPATGTPFIWGSVLTTTATPSSVSDLVVAGSTTTVNASAANNVAFNINQMLIGGRFNNGASDGGFLGDIGQVLIFNTALSPTDRLAVEAYLAGQWLPSPAYLPAATPLQIASGATVDLNGYNQTVASLSDATGGGLVTTSVAGVPSTLTLATSASTTFSGNIQDGAGQLALSVSGTGTQHLTGNSNYTGATNVSGGTLSLDVTNALTSTSVVSVSGTGTLALGAAGALNSAIPLNLNGGSLQAVNAPQSVANATTVTADSSLSGSQSLAFTGTVSISSGKTLHSNLAAGTVDLSGATVTNNGTLDAVTSLTTFGTHAASGKLSVQTAGTMTAGSISSSPLVTLNGSGVLNLGGTASPTVSTVTNITVGSGTATPTINLNTNAYLSVASITVPSLSVLKIGPNSGNDHLLTLTGGLSSITGGGQVDITNNDVIIQGQTAEQVRTALSSSYNSGLWTGSGLVTSLINVGNTSNAKAAIGYLSQSDFANYASSIDGYTPVAGDIVGAYTYAGDINLDGIVDIRDYRLMDLGYTQGFDASSGPLTGHWINGDVNYDGVVDYKDFALADASTFDEGNTVLANQMYQLHASEFGQSYINAFNADVPEPASLMLLGLGAAGLLLRRRK